MKIKCFRFPCEVCSNLASIQVFYRKDGSVGYARARHHGENKKFFYHQQTLNYINSKLRESAIDQGQQTKAANIDQTKPQTNPKTKMAGPMGFEPMTFSLEG
jgi:hypothetical protein